MTERAIDNPPRMETTLVLAPTHTYATVTDKIAGLILARRFTFVWLGAVGMMGMLVCLLMLAVTYLFGRGVGIWGVNIPVAWGFAIVNFVWWIGIGHAGTLISAILALLRQTWRNSINRFAEAMTLFAVACAGIFPLAHTGRPWLAYWLFPYPNTMRYWPNFRSPLVWDVFAVSTYLTISLVFWFIGLIPDLATLRDRAEQPWKQRVFGLLAMGWRGSARHWHRYETAYLLLAGLATPLVLSVHTVVSFDFAVGMVPGWHTTIFPPYFVAGAIYSGFAMVLCLAIPIRSIYGLKDFITERHLEISAKVMLATGLIVAYGYGMEAFMGWYSGSKFDSFLLWNRLHGPYRLWYAALLGCNIFIPQVLWLKKFRVSTGWLWLISFIVLVGMWLERFIIIVVSLSRDFVNSSWGQYYPTKWDWMTFFGTIGMFLTFMWLFVRVLPMISIFELRTLLPEAHVHESEEVKQ
jgi:molybdopterin-containing oxidoreductase family membrane subunit